MIPLRALTKPHSDDSRVRHYWDERLYGPVSRKPDSWGVSAVLGGGLDTACKHNVIYDAWSLSVIGDM